jgi:amino acid transporter
VRFNPEGEKVSAHQATPGSGSNRLPGPARVVVLTTVMLTFISFWRAAALVLNDLASTAYYIGGIAESNIGQIAPWFILLVMVFSFGVRWVYMESCSMFVRGGVYRIVKEAMGSTMAKIAVSALVFDFVLTGPISAVSAGHYVHSFIQSLSTQFHFPFPINAGFFSIILALAITLYFWFLNIKGVEESSDRALKIMIITGVMVLILDGWSILTIALKGGTIPSFHVKLDTNSLGWLKNVHWIQVFPVTLFFICLGHTLLAMSGEEALAQVYREIEAPKQTNLMKAAWTIFIFSMMFTGFTSFAAFMIVPEAKRLAAGDNLLNVLVLNFVGPGSLKLLMVGFVVTVGAMILAGAVNTSIFASNGVLNRVAEDGILADWFRQPHNRFGTTHRIIHLVGILQVATIIASRGDVHLLGEAYAFGVIWSFSFMAISMYILRFKYRGERTLKVPLNLRIGKTELPIGIGIVCIILVGVAITNLFTKKVATVSGIAFTATFFVMFLLSDLYNRRKRANAPLEPHKEKFILDRRSDLTPEALHLPEDENVLLVPVRDPNNLSHLKMALEEAHHEHNRIVVMTIKVDRTYRGDAEQRTPREAEKLLNEGDRLITHEEEYLFTKVVELAEKYGETVVPLVVPSNNSWFAIARTAHEINAKEVLMGKSARIPPDVQMEQMAVMWAMTGGGSSKELTLRIVDPDFEEPISVTL